MLESTKQFTAILDDNNHTYEVREEVDSGRDSVVIRFNGEHTDTITMLFVFSEDCEDVAIRVFNIVKGIAENKIAKMLDIINAQNCRYRYAKFCLNRRNNSVQMEMDASFRGNTIGEVCFELMLRTLQICDDAYPEFMKVQWA